MKSIPAYAAVVAPAGTSTTVQGLVAGMDDGLGFSVGALFGGFLYQKIGGKRSFQVYALIALATCIAHVLLRPASTHEIGTTSKANNQTAITDKESLENKKEINSEEKKLTEHVKEIA